MSQRSDQRHVADVSLIEVKAMSGFFEAGPLVVIHGKNSAGKPIVVSVRFPWWAWPLLVAGMVRSWALARESRIAELAAIDKTLGKEAA